MHIIHTLLVRGWILWMDIISVLMITFTTWQYEPAHICREFKSSQSLNTPKIMRGVKDDTRGNQSPPQTCGYWSQHLGMWQSPQASRQTKVAWSCGRCPLWPQSWCPHSTTWPCFPHTFHINLTPLKALHFNSTHTTQICSLLQYFVKAGSPV